MQIYENKSTQPKHLIRKNLAILTNDEAKHFIYLLNIKHGAKIAKNEQTSKHFCTFICLLARFASDWTEAHAESPLPFASVASGNLLPFVGP